jgi:pantetheine-phosphate adenylyltransferase
MTKAIYPGTFDPITYGHLDILKRASTIFDQIVLAIYDHHQKKPLFSANERRDLAQEAVQDLPQVEVVTFTDKLMVHFACEIGAQVIIRGLRAISDFESELSYAQANRKLEPKLETVFFMTSLQYSFLSSTGVKEIALLGGSLEGMVPDHVIQALKRKRQTES